MFVLRLVTVRCVRLMIAGVLCFAPTQAGGQSPAPVEHAPDMIGTFIIEGLSIHADHPEILHDVQFSESRILSEAELNAIAQKFYEQEINRTLLSELVESVNALYTEKNHKLSRAMLPRQNVKHGVLHIHLIEAKIGHITPKDMSLIDEDFIENSIGLKSGDLISLTDLETRLRRFNATNKSKVTTEIAAGSNFGETDIHIKVQEPDFVEWPSMQFDNHASDVAGFDQQSLTMTFNNLLGRDDETSLSYLNSDGTTARSFMFSVPVTHGGTNIAISMSSSYTRFSDDGVGESSTVGTRGNAHSGSFSISHPLYFTDRISIFGALAYAQSYSDVTLTNEQDRLTETRIKKYSFTMPMNYRNNKVHATLTPSFNRLRTENRSTLFGVNRKEWVTIYKVNSAFSRYLNRYATANIRADWAYSPEERALNVPSEILTIGGPSSVRAYQPNASSGLKGYFLSFELHSEIGNWGYITLPEWMPSVHPYLFYDYAFAQSRPGTKSREDYWSGYGAGVTIPVIGKYLSFDIYHARSLDSRVHDAQKAVARNEFLKFSLIVKFRLNGGKNDKSDTQPEPETNQPKGGVI